MSEKDDVIRHLDNFKNISSLSNIKYIEIMSHTVDKVETLCEKNFDETFKHINHHEILAENNFVAEKNKTRIDYEIVKNEKKIFCSIFPMFTGVSITEYILAESDSKFSEVSEKLLIFFVNELKIFLEQTQSCDPNNNKYKIQLMKLREMQAKLFPSFQDIGMFDIKSAYLPADLMGGNFIDGFYVVENIYQIVICDVGGYDATSSFTGATIRSMIRSHSSGKATPSSIIESVTTKLSKLLKDSISKMNFIILQINIKNGDLMISSFGSLNMLYFIGAKKSVTNLNVTEIGKQLAKKVNFKDIQLKIDGNDSLLFFSNGVKNATSADGKEQFSEKNIFTEYVSFLNESSVKITQNMIEKIYTFTDFAPLEEDIIILSVKKVKAM